MFQKIASYILLLSSLLCGQSQYITNQQSGHGLWEIHDGLDLLGSALAINQLARSGNSTASLLRARHAAQAYTDAPHYLFEALLGSLSAETPVAVTRYYGSDGSYSLEPETPGNPLCTAWVLMILGEHLTAEQLAPSVAYLLATEAGTPAALSSNDDFRYSLFIITALAKTYAAGKCLDLFPVHWDQEVCTMLQEYRNDWYFYDSQNLDTALMTLTTASLGDWETASRLRETLLSTCTRGIGWSEDYQSFDLVTTCFALEALGLFSLAVPSCTPDLCFYHPPELQSNGSYDLLLYNIGCAAAEYFHVTIYDLDSQGKTTLTQSLSVPLLHAGRSMKISFTPPESAVAMIIKADEAGVVQDLYRDNNDTYLLLTSCYYFHLSPIRVNGEETDAPVFLKPGQGVKLSATLLQLYPYGNLYAEYQWKADDTLIASRYTNNASPLTETNCQWYPVKGRYNITLRTWGSTGSASQQKTIEFTYDDAICFSKRNIDGTLQYCDTFLPREYVNIYAYAADDTLSPTVHIFKEGRLIRQANAVDAHHYQWFTGTVPAGEYTAVVTYTTAQGHVAATAEHTFQIQDYAVLEYPQILTPAYPITTYSSTPFSPLVSCQWGYVANRRDQVRLRWYILDSADEVLCESPVDTLELPPEAYNCYHEFPCTTIALFPTGGLYQLVTEIALGEQVIQDTMIIQVMNAPTLTLTNFVTPENIDENPATATTLIQLSASQLDSTGIPVSFVIANGPFHIANDPQNTITVRLEKIQDIHSLQIGSAPLIITTRYGKLSGGTALSPEREEGDAIQVQIANGATQFQYSPGKGKLLTDENATITLDLHQSTLNGAPVTPPIGQIEIHISGVDSDDFFN